MVLAKAYVAGLVVARDPKAPIHHPIGRNYSQNGALEQLAASFEQTSNADRVMLSVLHRVCDLRYPDCNGRPARSRRIGVCRGLRAAGHHRSCIPTGFTRRRFP